jgi:hypothetical protein
LPAVVEGADADEWLKMGAFGADELWERKVQNWLLLLLRFAITREAADRWAALAAADELDAAGTKRPAAPSFFHRTTKEVCEAVLAPGEKRPPRRPR